MKNPSIPLVVEVFLNTRKTSSLLKADLPSFKDQIYQRMEGLLQDLGIPALITLSITRKKDLDPSLHLRVNGIDCRLPYGFRYLHDISPEKLQKEIIALGKDGDHLT